MFGVVFLIEIGQVYSRDTPLAGRRGHVRRLITLVDQLFEG
ncbi:MAG TPA: hypothetical protein VKV73_16400 [Chloroflexota bacterium]|nr:hypothetical protein [Chloroflexota bacterium]